MDKRERKSIAHNRSARHEYEILETFECGVVLTGSRPWSTDYGRILPGSRSRGMASRGAYSPVLKWRRVERGPGP